MNELAAKLAAAHVSSGTFNDESAADAIVQPIAVRCFTNGLKDHKIQFFIKARNPATLTKAISDALEVNANEEEHAMWVYAGPSKPRAYYPQRGRDFHRGSSYFPRGSRGRGYGNNRARGQSYNRGRSNYHNNYHNNNNHNDNYENHNQNYHTGRGHQSNRGTNSRGRERQVNAVVTEPPRQTQQEEDVANVIDLFRD